MEENDFKTAKEIAIEKEIEKKIENILEKVKRSQCAGGCLPYYEERRGAMKIAHILMKNHDLSFGNANTLS